MDANKVMHPDNVVVTGGWTQDAWDMQSGDSLADLDLSDLPPVTPYRPAE